jgi:hypothetical protein
LQCFGTLKFIPQFQYLKPFATCLAVLYKSWFLKRIFTKPEEAVALDDYTTGGLIQSSSRDRGDDECKCIVRASPAVHWKLAFTPLLDEAIHQSGVKVGAGTPNCCWILGFQETGKQKTLLLVGCLHLLPTHLLLLIGWSH